MYGRFAIFKRRRQRSFVKRGPWNELGGRTPLSIGNGSGWPSVEGRNCFLEVINIVPRTDKILSAQLTFWLCWWKEGYEVEFFLFWCSYSPPLKVVNPWLMGHDTWKLESQKLVWTGCVKIPKPNLVLINLPLVTHSSLFLVAIYWFVSRVIFWFWSVSDLGSGQCCRVCSPLYLFHGKRALYQRHIPCNFSAQLLSFVCRNQFCEVFFCFENIRLPFFLARHLISFASHEYEDIFILGDLSAINFQRLVNNRLNEFQPNWPISCTIIVLVIVEILFWFCL